MKNRLNPIEIALRDLPEEGREFIYTRESGELNGILKDIIGSNNYRVELRISPMGNTFDLQGRVSTEIDEQCSVCAIDYKEPIRQSLHEMIVIERGLGKGDQMTKTNHAHEWEAQGPDYMILESDTFNVAEYVHEMIALAKPIRPLCSPESEGGCKNRDQKVERAWLSYGDEAMGTNIRANPFQVLEKMKLKS
ncbi:MAG: DUF177 domain-containing protein [Calothrix sp. SM1_5_4]|nr:DUF177 domain-containing protein [Calothrix sp. SM1_5_4]